ncbi:uncharacterized protein CTRU02_212829 [Colletotrichum truncatum]|uniref:Uncharacterized protein n=1 Tax=Colletotrichum truncatum TaxID=5467 RepID=A0ACC3YIZ6_COLTU
MESTYFLLLDDGHNYPLMYLNYIYHSTAFRNSIVRCQGVFNRHWTAFSIA